MAEHQRIFVVCDEFQGDEVVHGLNEHGHMFSFQVQGATCEQDIETSEINAYRFLEAQIGSELRG